MSAGGDRLTVTELLCWLAAIGLMSPLLLYAGSGWMPLPALYAIAAGIAVMLMLVGRRLHGVLLADVIADRRGAAPWLITVALVLLGVFLVLLAVVVALLVVLRDDRPALPV